MVDIISFLTDKDEKAAYEFTKQIAAASATSPEYYPYLEEFATLLTDCSSYVRTRAFTLCCSQARWDTEGKLEKILPDLLNVLHDSKPTVVRQCLKAIRDVIAFRPELAGTIKAELTGLDLSHYKDSMVPLIQKDLCEVLALFP